MNRSGNESMIVVFMSIAILGVLAVVCGGGFMFWQYQRTTMMRQQALMQMERAAAEQARALAEENARLATKSAEATLPEITLTEVSAQDAPNEAILKVIRDQEAAWNAGNIEAFMSGYSQSSELSFNSDGTVTHGWQATLDRYKSRYSSRDKMGQLEFTDLAVKLLNVDSAIVTGNWKLIRADDSPNGSFTLVFQIVEGDWKIIHDHTSSAPDPEETE